MKLLARLIVSAIVLSASTSFAAGGNGPAFHVNIDMDNRASLQRGATLFVNRCLSCHSAEFSRYNRVADDLGIPQAVMEENMIFTGRKFGQTMTVAMTTENATEWFGAPPPDLSVKARARGADWIYSFLKGYYVSEDSPRGVDNLMLPGTAMPHVLWDLQGYQALKAVDHQDEHADSGHFATPASPFELVQEGKMTAVEYDRAMTDLVNYLVYMAEPAQLKRKSVGVGVLFFLAAFGVIAYFLKKEYWKDIH